MSTLNTLRETCLKATVRFARETGKAAVLAELPKRYGELRLAYSSAQRFHDTARTEYFQSAPTPTDQKWRAVWPTTSSAMYPNLRQELLEHLSDQHGGFQPSELAHMHLAAERNCSAEYIRKLITQAKRTNKLRNGIFLLHKKYPTRRHH